MYHPEWDLYKPEQSLGKISFDYEVEGLVELKVYDTDWVGNTGWSIGCAY